MTKKDDGVGRAERTADGRYAPGYCPNPRGRPRKRKSELSDVLRAILGGKIGSLAAISPDMTVCEALLRTACQKGLTNHKAALDIMKFFERFQASCPDEPLSENEDEDIKALEQYIKREARRLALKQPRSEDGAPDGKEGGS